MSDFLYVCEFSNGHIKVGRSIDPQARIASHVDRVACMGVTLERHEVFACADAPEIREAELIAACGAACTARFKSEWFAGLDFVQVARWAEARAQRDMQRTAVQETRWSRLIAELRAAGWSHADLARECECGATTISRLALAQQAEPMHSMGETLLRLAKQDR